MDKYGRNAARDPPTLDGAYSESLTCSTPQTHCMHKHDARKLQVVSEHLGFVI